MSRGGLRTLAHRRTVSARAASTHVANVRPTAFFAGQSADTASMTAYQAFKIFSHVVLAMMLAGIVYAGIIAVTYWTGISV